MTKRPKLKLVKKRRPPKPLPSFVTENMEPGDEKLWPNGVPWSVYAGRAHAKVIRELIDAERRRAAAERKELAIERKAARVKKRRAKFRVVT